MTPTALAKIYVEESAAHGGTIPLLKSQQKLRLEGW
jgi:hypothetical protein